MSVTASRLVQRKKKTQSNENETTFLSLEVNVLKTNCYTQFNERENFVDTNYWILFFCWWDSNLLMIRIIYSAWLNSSSLRGSFINEVMADKPRVDEWWDEQNLICEMTFFMNCPEGKGSQSTWENFFSCHNLKFDEVFLWKTLN